VRVLILSQKYAPEPITRPGELARELIKRGHTAFALAGLPNYPTGRLYPGYRPCLIGRETLDGVAVLRTFEYPYHGRSAIRRIVNYGSFMASSLLGLFFLPAFDVIYVRHPPLTIGVAAWILSRLRGAPFVYDVQDIWPESAVISGLMKEGFLVRMLSRLERLVYSKAGHIIAATAEARENVLAKGVPGDKVSVLPNWVDEAEFVQDLPGLREKARQRLGWEGRFVVLFAGNIGLVQGLETAILAAERLRADGQVLLAIVGDGSDKARLVDLVKQKGLQGVVQFVERQPQGMMPAFMSASDVLMVHLNESPLSYFVIPAKTYTYLAARRPILMAMSGAAAQIVRDSKAGLVIPPEDPGRMAEAIDRLRKMPASERETLGRNGREYLVEHFAISKVIPRYEEVLKSTMAGPVAG